MALNTSPVGLSDATVQRQDGVDAVGDVRSHMGANSTSTSVERGVKDIEMVSIPSHQSVCGI